MAMASNQGDPDGQNNDRGGFLAIPGKGRIQNDTLAFFERLGLDPVRARGGRAYDGTMRGIDGISVNFLPSRDIATGLRQGTIHIGVTGEDLLSELNDSRADTSVAIAMPLGFSRADLVVSVPRYWIDVDDLSDLEEVAVAFRARHRRRLRVATKYPNLTRRFLASHGLADYRIVESLGATEGAPATGRADLISDITSSGATLAANGLKTLRNGLIMRSEAVLAISLAASWTPATLRALRHILDLAAAEHRARSVRELRFRYNSDDKDLLRLLADRFECSAPYGEAAMMIVHCPVRHLHAATVCLHKHGKEIVTAVRTDSIFERSNPFYERIRNLANFSALEGS